MKSPQTQKTEKHTWRYALQLFRTILHCTGFCKAAIFHSQRQPAGLITSFASSTIFSGRSLTTDVCIACSAMSAQPVQSATKNPVARTGSSRQVVPKGSIRISRNESKALWVQEERIRVQACWGKEQSRQRSKNGTQD
jgi:hypothetical protein